MTKAAIRERVTSTDVFLFPMAQIRFLDRCSIAVSVLCKEGLCRLYAVEIKDMLSQSRQVVKNLAHYV